MWIAILVTVLAVVVLTRVLVIFQDKIKFFVTGQDEGFKLGEIILLWKLAKETEMEEPAALYYSVPSLNSAIGQIVQRAKENGDESNPKIQTFIEKLYQYRTKIDISHDNKKGLESSKFLDKGQRLRIILKGKGVFASEILNNGHELAIRVPLQKNQLKLDGDEWIGEDVSVYLWRKGDARYVFDTRVTHSGIFNGQNVIYLAHSSSMERAQKRRSVRSECKINASLYFIDMENLDFTSVEVSEGYKCIVEDISEDGAMIRIGGKGQKDIQIKIQFELEDKLIVMFGIIRAVEFNPKINQSRLHFECIHIEKEMKNTILNYVYKIVSEDKKEVLEALAQTEQDELEDSSSQPNVNVENSMENENSEKLPDHEEDSLGLKKEESADIDIAELDVSEDL